MSTANIPTKTPKQFVQVTVRGLKVAQLIPPDALPADLVRPEPAYAGDPVIDIALDGSSLVARAKLNGKSVRRALKAIGEQGVENVNLLLQGVLKPPAAPGGPFVLECPGLSVLPKKPKEPPP
jgi:hypothetical protein